ncbi:MAG: hypothetical protein CMN10_15600 [Roseobacter sp.]|mgnify:CR=1 FL=1|jgi:glycosyltransferase involved in cell wall biosynthesis|nr:hypothetical protein [Roseobacter sp.]MBV49975.1 hypothetical protein [Roseobacter sp.]|tara:strand:- start:822 stop:2000 length:1179 start_codon:yes stop_codon:yes gene_type:complete
MNKNKNIETLDVRLMLDLSSIKSGGGAQLALNFIHSVRKNEFSLPIQMILLPEDFPFQNSIPEDIEVLSCPNKPASRILFEYTRLRSIVRERGINTVYTFFGPGLPRYSGVRSVVGMAYPILVYPESNYWKHIAMKESLAKKFQNYLRGARLKRADHIIFETTLMEQRAQDAGLVSNESSVVPPYPTTFLNSSPPPDFRTHGAKILFLAGPAQHKNLWRLPGIFSALKRENLAVKFFFSMDRQRFIDHCSVNGVEVHTELLDEFCSFLGPLAQDNLQEAFDQCNVVGNIADLESFSNNYLEAWLTGRPILASDRDFARNICGGSAIYVDPHNADSLLNGIRLFSAGKLDFSAIMSAGALALKQLPDHQARLNALAQIIGGSGASSAQVDPRK